MFGLAHESREALHDGAAVVLHDGLTVRAESALTPSTTHCSRIANDATITGAPRTEDNQWPLQLL